MIDNRKEPDLNHDDEMAALLPFYVANSLDEDTRQQVIQWIEKSPAGHRALDHALEEQAEIIQANEAISPPSGALARLMKDIDKEPARKARSEKGAGILQAVFDWFNTAPASLSWGVAAVLLLITGVQTNMLVNRVEPEPFVVSSGSGTSVPGPVVLVRFVPDANMGKISAALGKAGAMIIAGPRGRNTFLIRFDITGGEKDVRQRMTQLAARKDLIRLFAEKKSSD